MPEMPDDELRNAVDAIVARLQADVHAHLSRVEEHHQAREDDVRNAARRESDAQWSAKLDALREEWQAKLQSAQADATADAERRVAGESERVRAEAEQRLTAETDRVRKEAEQRLAAETDRVRAETERASADSVDRLRLELEQAAADAAARARVEMEQAAGHSTARLRQEMEGATEQATARLREELREEMEQAVSAERSRRAADLDAERERGRSEIEAERVKARTLTTALEDARAALVQERETARNLGESLLQARNDEVTAARASERQAQLAVVERLSGAVRSISAARSLSDTLSALVTAASSVAPRVALFVVNGRDLQGWRMVGFGDIPPASLRLPPGESDLLSTAASTGSSVSSAHASAPAFASLPSDRAALAVPITVGGQSVAVLYVDDGSPEEPEAPASWPEATQILGGHASACLAYITALRTTQAMRAAGGAAVRPPSAGAEEDSSARRYARLLVSEIKLYNEAAVRLGREKRDLLNRLRPEIERARRMYEERVSPSVGSRGAYFQQELVHTLADGDPALLGESV
jgi:hypothetical protein